MNNKSNKLIIKNSVGAVILQLVNIICGLMIPQVFINTFGSDVYGLTTSITQYLNYITLLEGGLSSVIMAALYKPILEGDNSRINAIVNATRKFFRQIGGIYIVYVMILGIVYPLIVDTGFSIKYIFALTVVLAAQLFVQYFFSLTYLILLNADKKVFLISMIQAVSVVLTVGAAYIGVKLFDDIIWIKLLTTVTVFIQPVLFSFYVKKYFKLDKKVEPDNKALSQRWDGFGQNLAYFIHLNTDVVVLTHLSTFKMVSVYTVYMFVANGIKMVAMSLSSAVTPSMGNILATNDKDAIKESFDKYQFMMGMISTVLFACGIVLVMPFINIYTRTFKDAPYHQPVFAVIILLAEFIYCIRDPYVSVVYSKGHFKQTSKYSYTEAAINIIISVICVKQWGLIGVAIGTLVAMTYRMIVMVHYACKNVLGLEAKRYVRGLILNIVFCMLSIPVAVIFKDLKLPGYIHWVLMGAATAAVIGAVYFVFAWLFFKKDMDLVIHTFIRRK